MRQPARQAEARSAQVAREGMLPLPPLSPGCSCGGARLTEAGSGHRGGLIPVPMAGVSSSSHSTTVAVADRGGAPRDVQGMLARSWRCASIAHSGLASRGTRQVGHPWQLDPAWTGGETAAVGSPVPPNPPTPSGAIPESPPAPEHLSWLVQFIERQSAPGVAIFVRMVVRGGRRALGPICHSARSHALAPGAMEGSCGARPPDPGSFSGISLPAACGSHLRAKTAPEPRTGGQPEAHSFYSGWCGLSPSVAPTGRAAGPAGRARGGASGEGRRSAPRCGATLAHPRP